MRIILHVGMHKTGSSSIQDTFFQFKDPSFEYVNYIGANHSSLFYYLFQDANKVLNTEFFKARGPDFEETFPHTKQKWRAEMEQQLRNAAEKTILFSAEAISQPSVRRANQRMADFFRNWTDDITVIGYARAPGGFIVSAFQELLKGGQINTSPQPNYRGRFEKLDEIFGRDKVIIHEFNRSKLIGGDVVKDFAQAVGIATPPDDQIVRSNESLSLEATALLYVQRKQGAGFVKGFARAHQANKTFISRLASIGDGKLAFSTAMLAPMLEEIADDVAWMEERLGHPFSEPDGGKQGGIHTLDDLVDIALLNYDAVLERLGENGPNIGPANLENLVRALEALQAKCYEEVAPRVVHKSPDHGLGNVRHNGRKTLAVDVEKPTEEELNLRRKLAHVLWNQENAGALPDDTDSRKALFQEAKTEYLKKAANLMQRLKNNGLDLVDHAS